MSLVTSNLQPWPTRKLKTLALLVTEKAADNSDFKVGLEHIENWTGRRIDSDATFEGTGVAFKKGDLLFGKLRPYLAKAWVADREGAAVGDFLVLRPNAEVSSSYLRDVLLSPQQIEAITASVYGAKMPRASWEFVRELETSAPALSDQLLVNQFLDRETAEIDAFIADQEELIALLTERRSATISHAVTKGLDPSAPMKDSGVEWLGAVPLSWRISRIGHAYNLTLGKMVNASKQVGDLIPYVRAGNLQDYGLDLTEIKKLHATQQELQALSLLSGDVLVVEGGAGYGRSDYLQKDLPGWIFQNHVIRARPIGEQNGRYFDYYVKSLRARGHFESLGSFATIPNLSSEKLASIEFPFVPAPDQAAIVEHLDRETAEIDANIADAREAIALSKERRAALISAAVTGKIDVRNHGATVHEGVK